MDKQEAEVACDFCWPCSGEGGCERDWNRPCPHGYAAEPIDFRAYGETVRPTCVADVNYDGACEALVQFAHEGDKKEFAERCGVSWPCKSRCQGSGSTCPLDWTHIGDGVCAAPKYFQAEGCRLLQGFRGWTPTMKSEFAQRCGVAWPCPTTSGVDHVDGPVRSGTAACTELNMAPCPFAWRSSATGVCRPPEFSTGPCSQPLQAAAMTVEEKLRWAGDCLLPWDCNDGIRSGPRTPWNVQAPGDGPLHEAEVS